MRDTRFWQVTHSLFTTFQVMFVIVMALVAASQNLDVSTVKEAAPILSEPLRILQNWNKVLVPLLAGFLVILEWMKRMVGRPSHWMALRLTLDAFRAHAYPDRGDDDIHLNRITLFKFQRFCSPFRGRWPWWAGWLVPILRTGHLTQSSRTLFRAPDRPEEAKMVRGKPRGEHDVQQGVAGLAWAKESVYIVSGLPDVSRSPSDEDLRKYSSKAGVSIEWIRRHEPVARSYCGIFVEVRGKPWGVIVLDSHTPKGIISARKRKYELIGEVVGVLC